MDEGKIDGVVKDLVADHDRQEGNLTTSQIDKLLHKRQLSIDECAEVLRQLAKVGISVDDEFDNTQEDLLSSVLTHDPAYTNDDGVNQHFDGGIYNGLGHKLLTAAEEVELGRQMELGRRARQELENGIEKSEEHERMIERALRAKEIMITLNLRLVHHVAKPFSHFSSLSIDDLCQEGVIGLMRAADKYDHTLGYKFSTYATWWIRQSVTRSLADRGATIRLPVHVYGDVLRFKRAYKLLSQSSSGRTIRVSEIADELTWNVDKVHFIQQTARLVPLNLDESTGDINVFSLKDTLISDFPEPEDLVSQIELETQINNSLDNLKEREAEVLRLRFGLAGTGHGSTLEEIGQIYGLTRERIRQIEAKALYNLRTTSRGFGLRDFQDT